MSYPLALQCPGGEGACDGSCGWGRCGEECTDLRFDPGNCGGCGNACDAAGCNEGLCNAPTRVTLTPPNCAFGTVVIGGSGVCEVTVTYEGPSSEIELAGVAFATAQADPAVFTVEGVTILFPAFLTSMTLPLHATPHTPGLFENELVLEFNNTWVPEIRIPLSATGVVP